MSAHDTTMQWSRAQFTGGVLAKAGTRPLSQVSPRGRWLLLALWLVQEARGWVSDGSVKLKWQEKLESTLAYVRGVVTFYTLYHTHPVGRHFIQVCTTSPCAMCGAADVVQALLQHTTCGDLGATSADGRFTVSEVECLGACGFVTPIIIDDDFIDSVTPERVPEILARYP